MIVLKKIFDNFYKEHLEVFINEKYHVMFFVSLIIFLSNKILFSNFNFNTQVNFMYNLILFLSPIVFYFVFNLKVNSWLFFAFFFVACPSSIIGFHNNYIFYDILSDFIRYLAPFIGYSCGIIILSYLKLKEIKLFLIIIFFVEFIFYFISLFNKLSSIASGAPLIQYAKNGLEVNIFFFILFFAFYYKNILFKFYNNFFLIYIFSFILNPILVASKTKIVILFIAFIYILKNIIRNNTISLLLLFLFFLPIIFLSYITEGNLLLDRIINFFNQIIYPTIRYDNSTSYRLLEIRQVYQNISEHFPLSIFYGFGSGSLVTFDKYDYIGGVHLENFRESGGVHHIFNSVAMYINRYGMIGLIFIIIFLLKVKSYLEKNKIEDLFSNCVITTIPIYIIVSFVADFFVPVHIYANFHFGFILSVGVLIFDKIVYSSSNY